MRLLHNARIHTFNPQQPSATALAIDHGLILAVGNDAEILSQFESFSWKNNPITRQDLGGRPLLPGLIDAHIHLQHYSLGLQKVDCETSTQAECLRRVAERVRNTPHGEWILGHGWNQNDWPEGFGTAADLDAIAPHQLVYLTAKSLHAGWANTAALHLAGLDRHSADPPGGRLQREESGNLTGILYESAMDLVAQAIPVPSLEQVAQAIKNAQPQLWGFGLTGVHDFDRQLCFSALQLLHSRGDLGLRVLKSIPLEALPQAVEIGLRSGFGDDFLRIGQVKAFADGALGPRTAAMLQPYEGEPGNRGMLLLDAEELFERGRLAVENGLPLAVHAIGDAANHAVLDAFDQLRQVERQLASTSPEFTTRPGFLRHRIEHVQIIHPGDMPRLAEMDLIASMQPIHATSDYLMADRFWGSRAANSYAWRSLLALDIKMAFGSDAPVDSPNPFWGLHAAVTRQRHDGTPGPDGWYPDQRLTVSEALSSFTVGAAYAAGMETRLGRLAPGFLADLIVLDTDPFRCEAEKLKDIHPLGTMIAGEWVYSTID